jgi:hypothetical protein
VALVKQVTEAAAEAKKKKDAGAARGSVYIYIYIYFLIFFWYLTDLTVLLVSTLMSSSPPSLLHN